MKRFLLRTLLSVPALLAGLVIVSALAQLHPKLEYFLFAKGPFGSTFFRMSDFDAADDSFDIVTLGSSTCNRGIDPRPFAEEEMTAFNLCSSSQSFFNAEFVLDWSLNKRKKPRAILVDVYPAIWSHDGIESARDLTINHNHCFHLPFQQMAWATGDVQTILKAGYFGVKRRLCPAPGVFDSQIPFRYVPGGLSYTLMPPVDSVECAPDTVEMSSKQARAFERIRATCEKEGIQLLLVNPPQLCEEVFEKPDVMKGLPWIEGNDWPLAKVDTLYYDDHHLRGVGAELYSEWLAGEVAALLD